MSTRLGNDRTSLVQAAIIRVKMLFRKKNITENFALISIAIVCCILFAGDAFAAEDAPNFLRVPVFFITDRNLLNGDDAKKMVFGRQRKYISNCKEDPFMGSGYCVIENTDGKVLTDELKQLGWSVASPEEKRESSKVELIKKENFEQIQEDFYKSVADSTLKTKKAETILFAHGFNTSFDVGFRSAAKFAYKFESPAVLYSWPSVQRVRGYSADENNNQWSQEHFNTVIERLESMCASNPIKLRIVAHSMGTRLIVRASPILRNHKCVSEVTLICPDIDAGVVDHYARRYLSLSGTTEIRLFMSQHDKALVASQFLHGGYCRFGECADSIKSLVTLPLEAMALKPQAKEVESEVLAHAKQRMQTIDFTVLDRGFIGHNIPFDLVYNISTTGLPGEGLKTIDEHSGERSKLSRAFSRLSHLETPQVEPQGTCLRIVKERRRTKK